MAGRKGRSGRRKAPAESKKLAGTYRADRDQDEVAFPADSGPPIPKGLHPDAVKEWKRLAPICIQRGLLTEGDWLAWRLGFSAFSTWLIASARLESPAKWTFSTMNGYESPAPEVAIAKQAWASVMCFCREFGLTPSSRSGLKLAPVLKPSGDPMEGMLN